jgi:ArsR family transcriptional regulator
MSTVARTTFDDVKVTRVAAILAALGDETRLKMVQLLGGHDALCVCELQQAFDLGQPTISHHLRILREAGLVDVVRRGTWAYYSLRRDAVKHLARNLVEAA